MITVCLVVRLHKQKTTPTNKKSDTNHHLLQSHKTMGFNVQVDETKTLAESDLFTVVKAKMALPNDLDLNLTPLRISRLMKELDTTKTFSELDIKNHTTLHMEMMVE